jgi:hypothetical protein
MKAEDVTETLNLALQASRPGSGPRRSSATTALRQWLVVHLGRSGERARRAHHESLKNLTPADVYFGRGQKILMQRERIKRATIKTRRLQHQLTAA